MLLKPNKITKIDLSQGLSPLKYDNFLDLDNWEALNTRHSATKDEWTISNNHLYTPVNLSEAGDYYLKLNNIQFRKGEAEIVYYYSSAVNGGPNWIGFLFEDVNTNERYMVAFFPNSSVQLWTFPLSSLSKKQEISFSGNAQASFVDGKKYLLKVKFKGHKIDVFVNGINVATLDDSLLLNYNKGFLGIMQDRMEEFEISNFSFKKINKPLIHTVGSSVTYGIGATNDWATLMKIKGENNNLDFDIINKAVSGYTTSDMLSSFETELQNYRPDISIIETSINDSKPTNSIDTDTTLSNISQMVNLAREYNSTPIVWTSSIFSKDINSTDWQESNWYFMQEANAKIKRWCLENGVNLSDVFTAFNGDFSLIQSDDLHPNDDGQQLIADTIYNYISKFNQ
jgi:lysophospholipase L1-like esterase